MTRYCHTSTKYTWYFLQKVLVFSKNFIFFCLLYNSINAQFSDTLQFKYRDSKVLIVSKSSTDNEWEFENSLTDEKVNNNKMKMNFSVGNIHLNNNSIFTGVNSFSPIEYKTFNSMNMSFSIYLKSFEIKKEYLKLFLGVGVRKNKLDLNKQLLNISQDTILLHNSSTIQTSSISKSILSHHYFTIPVNFSWMPFPKKNPNIKTQLEVVNQFLMVGKSKFKYNENGLVRSEITKSDFFNNNYHLSGNLKFIWKNVGVFLQTNITQYSKLYKSLFTYSYGLTLCI